jgi:hypothetical protein
MPDSATVSLSRSAEYGDNGPLCKDGSDDCWDDPEQMVCGEWTRTTYPGVLQRPEQVVRAAVLVEARRHGVGEDDERVRRQQPPHPQRAAHPRSRDALGRVRSDVLLRRERLPDARGDHRPDRAGMVRRARSAAGPGRRAAVVGPEQHRKDDERILIRGEILGYAMRVPGGSWRAGVRVRAHAHHSSTTARASCTPSPTNHPGT